MEKQLSWFDDPLVKKCTIKLHEFNIPRLHQPSLTSLFCGHTSGWYKVSNNIEHSYDKILHTFQLSVPLDLDEFYILFVPFTTGKYEEEVKYKLVFTKNDCTVYIQEAKYTNKRLEWSALKTYSIMHLFS